MVTQLNPPTKADIIYPDSDGKPMANNTVQFRWILVIEQNLDWLFADNPNVFVAGDLFWYPVEGNNKIVNAPDVMVVFGRPKGDRGSYKQWEENNIPPQVVFEILSPGNTSREMAQKLLFYNRHGVEEYYIYDPDRHTLEGWLKNNDDLEPIDNIGNWTSPRLGITFQLVEDELDIYRPDGLKFFSYNEISQQLNNTQQELNNTQQELNNTQQELNNTQQELNNTQQELEKQREKAEKLAALLREKGLDPDLI